jgi:hypothetical protein
MTLPGEQTGYECTLTIPDPNEHCYLDIRLIDPSGEKVLAAEIDGFRVFPPASVSAFKQTHDDSLTGYEEAMQRYLLARRVSPTGTYFTLFGADPGGGGTETNRLGGFPLGGIVINVTAPATNHGTTPVITPIPNGG